MVPIFQFPLRNNVKISDFHLALRKQRKEKKSEIFENSEIPKKKHKILKILKFRKNKIFENSEIPKKKHKILKILKFRKKI